MLDYEYNWRPCMQTMGIPSQYYPMMTMPDQQLENMYPKIYNIIYPVVISHCDEMDMKYGTMYTPSKEQLEATTDNILTKVEANVEEAIKQDSGWDERQFGFGGRRLLRGLIGILLIRELLRRRRRPFFGFPFGGGFGPGLGGGFGPGFGGGF